MVIKSRELRLVKHAAYMQEMKMQTVLVRKQREETISEMLV
jgi:hypothetical protein